MLGNSSESVEKVKQYASENGDAFLSLCATLESELSSLNPIEKKEFLNEYGIQEAGLTQLSQASFSLLGLETYLTSGEKETRAWTIKREQKHHKLLASFIQILKKALFVPM